MTSRERAVLGSLVVLCVLGLRALVGVVTGLPTDSPERGDIRMSPLESLAAVDEALVREGVHAADHAWRVAHSTVTRDPSWNAFAELGDAALRISQRSGQPDAYLGRARDAYFAALTRARAEGSVAGVTRVWRAFVALGDR